MYFIIFYFNLFHFYLIWGDDVVYLMYMLIIYTQLHLQWKKIWGDLLHYRQLFVKGNLFIGEWGIFGADIFLRYSQFFFKADLIIGRVECILFVVLLLFIYSFFYYKLIRHRCRSAEVDYLCIIYAQMLLCRLLMVNLLKHWCCAEVFILALILLCKSIGGKPLEALMLWYRGTLFSF